MSAHANVVILDYGSQYTQLIARRVRELGVHSVLLPGTTSLDRIAALKPKAMILSGGPQSVYAPGALGLPAGLLELQTRERFPILGICYGMQLLALELGGEVKGSSVREYGRSQVRTTGKASLLFPASEEARPAQWMAWMSHGDSVTRVPAGWNTTAISENGGITAMEPATGHAGAWIGGLQFHPEVAHTERGAEVLQAFLTRVAHLSPDWTMRSVVEEQIARIRAEVPETAQVICALSGGVDSAVAATLVHRAIGERLHCVFVDTGLLRLHERDRVMALFENHLHLPVECVDASARFLSALAGVSDPEQKRKIIGREFISVFESSAQNLEHRLGERPSFLVQGTLYPDVIESSPGHTTAATIKSHHNVGGLPKDLRFKLIEPLRDLFKDEVRALGRELGVPDEFLKRHPFPGPGLAVRVIGEITPERLEILRAADEIFIEEIRAAGVYDAIWQAFAVFLPLKSVGVQGDGRTHSYVVGLRAVGSQDGMTADWYPMDHRLLARASSRICNEVRGVNRVVYDITSKPPATIEWE